MSNAFDKASLVMLPHAYEEGKLYSLKPTDRSGDFTFSRGTDTATRVNASGNIEKETQNLLLQSNTFSNATWLQTSCSVASGQSGYDGSSDAWLLSKSDANGRVRQYMTSTGVRTASIYAKEGTTSWLRITYGGKTTYFDLGNGVLGSVNAIDSTITSVGNGFYRCTLTANAASADYVNIYPADSDGVTSGTSGSIYIQDAMLNQGLVAYPYLETTTAPVYGGLTDDMPRLDYSGGATCPSLLLEPNRTNLIEYSEYWNDWQEVRTTLSFNEATSPEGIQNASLLVDSVDLNTHISQAIYNTSSGTTPVTWSLFAKKQNNRYISLRLQDDAANASGNTNYIVANYDLESGVVTDTLESGSPTNAIADIEDYGNGWYRLIISMTKKSGVTRTDTQIRLCKDGTAKTGEAFAGTGNDGNYIYGLQLEAGSYPTSYIPTYGSSQTRGADDISTVFSTPISTDGNVSYFIHLNGSNFEKNMTGKGASFDFASNNYITYNVNNAGFHRIRVNVGGSNTYTTSVLKSEEAKILTTINGTNVKVFVNGVENYDETLPVVPDFTSVLSFVTNSSDLLGELPIKQILLFPTALSDSECIALTTV